ncbi:MAG: hypothetical protein KBT00_08510 [Bacteroidales bacterium]|nr:hypothetical protein [Candidatus Cacconaster merdequi]
MKLKVIANLPFTLDDKDFVQSQDVYMEFPQIPRPGELVDLQDPNCAPLAMEMLAFISKVAEKEIIYGYNPQVIKNIMYHNGEAIVMIGTDPSMYIIQGETPEKRSKKFYLFSSLPPKVNDLVCNSDDWYITSVNHIGLNSFWVGTDDEPVD